MSIDALDDSTVDTNEDKQKFSGRIFSCEHKFVPKIDVASYNRPQISPPSDDVRTLMNYSMRLGRAVNVKYLERTFSTT